MELFHSHYLPALTGNSPAIRNFALYTLTDDAEQDDHCANLYHKSLLYLVSRAFEEEYKPFQWKWPGAPLLGMEKFVRADAALMSLFKRNSATWVLAPNHDADPLKHSSSSSHGAFDDDRATVKGTLLRILGNGSSTKPFEFTRSASSRKDIRAQIQTAR
jgi:hypothetical protein